MITLSKKLIITEKPSVAMEFAKALKITTSRKNGYLESNDWIITWCVGHLVTMSYPEKYDEKLKFWRLDTLPFIPEEWKYEIIPQVQNQFNIVQQLLQREDVEEIYKKLVRDNIPEIIQKNGELPYFRVLNDEEYWECLIAKDIEELEEVKKATSLMERKEELADKLEVLRAMIKFCGASFDEIQEIADLKKAKKGGFSRRLYLEKVETDK